MGGAVEESVEGDVFWKSILTFSSCILREGEIFLLFFENEGREFSNNKS